MSSKNKRIKAGKFCFSNTPRANDQQKNSDDKNISLDLSYPTLLMSVRYKEFSNYFQTASDYMEYEHYLNSKLFPHLCMITRKEFVRDEVTKRHVHKLDEEEREFLIEILKETSKLYQISNVDEFVEQNLKDENEYWQYGLERSNGRVFGVFKDEVFMPILYDPNHLFHKTNKGRQRRFTDASVYNFSPSKFPNIEYPKRCIRCNNGLGEIKQIIPFEKDVGLNTNTYICYDCFKKMILSGYRGNNSEVIACLELLEQSLENQN